MSKEELLTFSMNYVIIAINRKKYISLASKDGGYSGELSNLIINKYDNSNRKSEPRKNIIQKTTTKQENAKREGGKNHKNTSTLKRNSSNSFLKGKQTHTQKKTQG